VTVVVFDLDNTLVDRDGALRAWLGATVPPDQIDVCLNIDAGGYGDRARFFRTVATLAQRSEAHVRARFRAELPSYIRPLPGAHDLLQRLLPCHRLAIATHGSNGMQRAKLAAADFSVTWATIAISEEVGAAKPRLAFFRHLLGALGCVGADALMVGDHPIHDIAGARRAGMRTCWLRTRHHPPPIATDQIVDHLEQVRP
jgi:HAD superfamily hydrolase (TIGR01549 family)